MLRAISSVEMSAVDRNAQHLGIEPIVLMENAGRQVAWEISKRAKPSSVAVLCGPGNNGGDGFVAARHLRNMGWDVLVVEVGEPGKAQAARNRQIVHRMSAIELASISDSAQAMEADFRKSLRDRSVLVDALLGTGARGAPREPMASVIRATEDSGALRVAVDIPSGMNADSGEREGVAFRTDLTVTFHRAKTGHLAAREFVGDLVVADIGIPEEAESLVGPGDLLFVRDGRAQTSHKGDNGVLLIVGGSKDYHGAPALCGIAAMRTGIDLAYIVVPEAIREIVAKHSPSLIVRSYPGARLKPDSTPTILDLAEKADAVCVGPGLGRDGDTLRAVGKLVDSMSHKPLVLDADALKAYAGETNRLGEKTVITPHAGEFRTLTGVELPDKGDQRTRIVAEWAARNSCVWVVKGRDDVIAQGQQVKVNGTGTACMTVGGTGDCLTGVIGALVAKGNDPFRSAAAGCFIAGRAGELASERRGCHLLPTDVAEEIPNVFEESR